INEDPTKNDTYKNIHDCSDSSSYYSKVDHLVDVKDIQNYHNSSYMNNGSKNDEPHYHFNFCIDSYLRSQICTDSSILSGSDNSNDNYVYNYICGEGRNSSEGNDLTLKESSNDLDLYKDLWVQCECENCYGVNYKKSLNSNRIELSIDPGTWGPMDEDMISLDPIEFQSEEELHKDRIDFYQRKTGLTEAIQTSTGQLNGIRGSMGSVVGEKITRLIEYATNNFLPLILVCASGGARMQEGSLSLMQIAKISKLFYVSILTSPTT
ncbi:hypothetical protein ERO13_A09G101966v2, partial [Gossypium hirsutum]